MEFMLRLMRSFLVFAEQLALLDMVTTAARRLAVYVMLITMAALLALASAGCAVAGLWIWADQRFGAVDAPLLVAAVLAGLAGLLLVVLSLQRQVARRSRADRATRAVQDLATAPGRLMTVAAQGFINGLANGRTAREHRP
jgi:hypothetical protein